jgi:hypothetical protein
MYDSRLNTMNKIKKILFFSIFGGGVALLLLSLNSFVQQNNLVRHNVLGLFDKNVTSYKASGSFAAKSFIQGVRQNFKEMVMSSYPLTITHTDAPEVKRNVVSLSVDEEGVVSGFGEIYPIAVKYRALQPNDSGKSSTAGFIDERIEFSFSGTINGTKLRGSVKAVITYGQYYGNSEGAPSPGRSEYTLEWKAVVVDDQVKGIVYNLLKQDLKFLLNVDSASPTLDDTPKEKTSLWDRFRDSTMDRLPFFKKVQDATTRDTKQIDNDLMGDDPEKAKEATDAMEKHEEDIVDIAVDAGKKGVELVHDSTGFWGKLKKFFNK